MKPPVIQPFAMIERGKAAEHIVCADLILKGYRAYLSDQALPYDVVLDHDGKLYRVQVKGTLVVKNASASRRQPRMAYVWAVRRRGSGGRRHLDESHCDLIALVALDIRAVAYFPVSSCGQTVALDAPGKQAPIKGGRKTWGKSVDQFPIERALGNDFSFYRQAGYRGHSHCPAGHPYDEKNRASDGCEECRRTRNRNRYRENHPGVKVRRLD